MRSLTGTAQSRHTPNVRTRFVDVAFGLDPSLTSDWQEVGLAVPVLTFRTRVETPELVLWRECLRDALDAVQMLRDGRSPSALAGKTHMSTPTHKAEMAAELVAWADSHNVGGLRWILDVLEAHSGLPADGERVARWVKTSLSRWSRLARKRRARIVPLGGVSPQTPNKRNAVGNPT